MNKITYNNERAYELGCSVIEEYEHRGQNIKVDKEIYEQAIFLLIELEYSYMNFSQARFQLRKLITQLYHETFDWNRTCYWTILLDEIPFMIVQKNWCLVKSEIYDSKLYCFFNIFVKISKREITMNDQEFLKDITFEDEKLGLKKKVLCTYVKMLFKEYQWMEDVEYLKQTYDPKDLLFAMTYSQYIGRNNKVLLGSFWEKNFPLHSDKPEAIKAYWQSIDRAKYTEIGSIKIAFLGGGDEIGGSCILISDGVRHFMLDAGMYMQENKLFPDFNLLKDLNINFQDIKCVLLSHAHLDHSGALPYLYKKNKRTSMFATEPTVKLVKVLMKDMKKNDKLKNEIFEDSYASSNIDGMLAAIQRVGFTKSFKPFEGLEVTLFPAGHIIGAAAIYMNFNGTRILYTGDFSISEQNTVSEMCLPDDLEVDILITETTYGYTSRNFALNRSLQESMLINKVINVIEKGGTVLVPAFSVGRAQEVLISIKEAFRKQRFLPFDIFLDGRVGEICDIYQQYAERKEYVHPKCYREIDDDPLFNGGGIHLAKEHYNSDVEFDYFIESTVKRGGNCIVASSGMLLEESASYNYAKNLIENNKNEIIFTGYLSKDSPGYRIVKLAKDHSYSFVNFSGKSVELNANISAVSLSAHASKNEILKLIIKLKPQCVFLAHGDSKSSDLKHKEAMKKIYPSIIECLKSIKDIDVISAESGKVYTTK